MYYSDGKLTHTVSRGTNGEIGEILPAMMECNSIPKTIPYLGACTIRGEVYIPYSSFNALGLGEESEYKNPRNL